MLLTFENLSRILRFEPASQPQNLRAEPQKLQRGTLRSNCNRGVTCDTGMRGSFDCLQ